MNKAKCRSAIVVAILLGLSALLGACSGDLTGVVAGKADQKPVPGATVRTGSLSAVTDSTGHYTIAKVPTGTTTVSVSAAGYGSTTSHVDVKRGQNAFDAALVDGEVAGSLKENAVGALAIAKAHVTIAGKVATVTGARFSAADVPVGPQQMVVTAPAHETYSTKINVAPGENTVKVALDLTPTATYTRYYEAYRFGHYRLAYLYVHPDVRRHYSYRKFVKDMSSEITVGFRIFATRNMARWHPAFAHKTYRDVVAVDRTVTYSLGYGNQTDNYTQHFQQIKGRWYIIWDWTS